jgi:hypothetical protein
VQPWDGSNGPKFVRKKKIIALIAHCKIISEGMIVTKKSENK